MNDNSYLHEGHGSSMLTGFVVGALVGAGLALLLAPASGQDTRRRLGETARKIREDAKDRVKDARDTVASLKDEARSAIETGREAFSQARQQRREGTETGANRPL